MRARMNNAIEVKVEIVHFFTVGIWFGRIYWILMAVRFVGLLLYHGGDDLWVLFVEPSKERRNTHGDDGGSLVEERWKNRLEWKIEIVEVMKRRGKLSAFFSSKRLASVIAL